jgi:hypothetical protein
MDKLIPLFDIARDVNLSNEDMNLFKAFAKYYNCWNLALAEVPPMNLHKPIPKEQLTKIFDELDKLFHHKYLLSYYSKLLNAELSVSEISHQLEKFENEWKRNSQEWYRIISGLHQSNCFPNTRPTGMGWNPNAKHPENMDYCPISHQKINHSFPWYDEESVRLYCEFFLENEKSLRLIPDTFAPDCTHYRRHSHSNPWVESLNWPKKTP